MDLSLPTPRDFVFYRPWTKSIIDGQVLSSPGDSTALFKDQVHLPVSYPSSDTAPAAECEAGNVCLTRHITLLVR